MSEITEINEPLLAAIANGTANHLNLDEVVLTPQTAQDLAKAIESPKSKIVQLYLGNDPHQNVVWDAVERRAPETLLLADSDQGTIGAQIDANKKSVDGFINKILQHLTDTEKTVLTPEEVAEAARIMPAINFTIEQQIENHEEQPVNLMIKLAGQKIEQYIIHSLATTKDPKTGYIARVELEDNSRFKHRQ